jgi:hypothetical protein
LDLHSLSKYQAENTQNSEMDFIIDLAKCLINFTKPLIQDLIKTFRGSSSDFMGSDFIIFDLILVTIIMMVVVSGCLDDFIINFLKWILNFFIWNLSERWQQEEEPRRQIILGGKKLKFSGTLPNPKRSDLNSVEAKTSVIIEEEVKEKLKKVEGKTSLPKSRSKDLNSILKALNSTKPKTSKPIEGGPSLTSKLHPKIELQTQDPSNSADVV